MLASFNPKFVKFKSLPESERSKGSLFLKEVREVRNFFEAKAVGDLRNIPVGLFQKYFGLLYDTCADEIGGSLAGVFF